MLTKQEKWYLKARKAGIRRRTYHIPDKLDALMVEYMNDPNVDPLCTSKSIIVQTALERFFRPTYAEILIGRLIIDCSRALA